MAQAPMPMPAPSPGAAGGMGGDPMAGVADDAGAEADDTVVVTICKNGDGTYTVYPGDEPEGGGAGDADMGEDDASMGGPAAPIGGAAPEGQPADSIGAALKAALDIMQADASSEGGGGSAQDQFSAGFSADKAPTPAMGSPAQRF